eukprot:SAG31_NODE_2400_length_5775_cov_2.602185_9_plen_195_part_00
MSTDSGSSVSRSYSSDFGGSGAAGTAVGADDSPAGSGTTAPAAIAAAAFSLAAESICCSAPERGARSFAPAAAAAVSCCCGGAEETTQPVSGDAPSRIENRDTRSIEIVGEVGVPKLECPKQNKKLGAQCSCQRVLTSIVSVRSVEACCVADERVCETWARRLRGQNHRAVASFAKCIQSVRDILPPAPRLVSH